MEKQSGQQLKVLECLSRTYQEFYEESAVAPVPSHPVHEKVKQKEGFRYGCWNLSRPIERQEVISKFINAIHGWSGCVRPYRFSTECRFDMSLNDPACEGCKHRGSGEKYAEEIRRNGK